MGIEERQGDFQIETVDPTAEDVLARLGLEPGGDGLQAALVEVWGELSELERELVSEAGYV